MATGSNTKKRFTDVHIWDQPWFIDLEKEHKLFWFYMNAKCDNVGVYAHSERKVSFDIRFNIETGKIEEIFNQRDVQVKALENGTFLLVQFCKFQHCNKSSLVPSSKVFVTYMKDVKEAGLIRYFYENQPSVLSDTSLIFFEAFEQGILQFKYYSNNKDKRTNGLTEFELAFNKAIESLDSMPYEYHTYPIDKALASHQGKGKEKGSSKGLGKSSGATKGSGTSDYELSKDIACRVNPNFQHTDVKLIQALASHLKKELNEESPHELINCTMNSLLEHFGNEELTIQLLIDETKKAYL